MRLDTLPHVEVNRVVEEHVGDFAARVYTPQPDVNRDHGVLFDSVAVATRPTPGQVVRRSSRTRRPRAPSGRPRRQLVHPELVRRRERDDRAEDRGFAHYETERREYPHPRSDAGRFRLSGRRVLRLLAAASRMPSRSSSSRANLNPRHLRGLGCARAWRGGRSWLIVLALGATAARRVSP